MTISQTILLISIGNIIVEPFANEDLFSTIVVAGVFTCMLILFEYCELKIRKFEDILIGDSINLVIDGKVDIKNLKKIRMTEGELKSRLRQKGIYDYNTLEVVTLEYNGEIGYKIKKEFTPITYKEIKEMLEYKNNKKV